MQSWYFAYGSNLWIDQMLARTGELGQGADRPRIARLADYRLVFQQPGGESAAYANILSPGAGVLGVIYRCSEAALVALDGYEHNYDRQLLTVVDSFGERIQAIAYVMRPTAGDTFAAPSAEYLRKIVTGAKQHGLPQEYVDDLVDIAATGDRPAKAS